MLPSLQPYTDEPITRHHPSVASIQRAVAASFHIPLIEMVSQRRGRDVAWPRQYAMLLAREMTPLSLPNIGRHFGFRDHTTIMHGIAQAKARLKADKELAGKVRYLRRKLMA
jgi:chromosomal replication initiator protein